MTDSKAPIPSSNPKAGLQSLSIEPRGGGYAVIACFHSLEEATSYRDQLSRSAVETTPPRVWLAMKGTEEALTLREDDGWEVHEVAKPNSPEDIRQSMDLLQQIHRDSEKAPTQSYCLGCGEPQPCPSDCPAGSVTEKASADRGICHGQSAHDWQRRGSGVRECKKCGAEDLE